MKKRPARQHGRVSLASSVRTRLTLWYLALMAFIIFIYGGSLYASETFLSSYIVESQLDAQLYQDSPRLVDTYKQALLAHRALATVRLPLADQEATLLLSPEGRVLDARGPLASNLSVPQLQAEATQNSGIINLAIPWMQHEDWQGSGTNYITYRALITPVLNQNVRVATLLVGLPLQDTIPLFAIWCFFGIVALIVAAIGGYLLAGKALRPVKMITRTANEISATDLRRRLHLRRRDEFGQLAATFDQMLTRLEAAFKRQARFTADASHELRTPLTIIDLEVNRALTQCERPEEYHQALEQIQAENAQMAAIVNSLLLLARADSGQLVLDLQEVDLGDLALGCVERLLPLARQHQIILATGELPEVLVRGDPHYLMQMLTNVIENGIKYSSGVGKRVHVELTCEEECWAVIYVQDDGHGIAEEHLPLLFDRFYRVDKARLRTQRGREEPGGTGLGLSIVQWIVQAHNGEIDVESSLGAGSLFEIRLPLLRRTEA